jgi:hypothetical protein
MRSLNGWRPWLPPRFELSPPSEMLQHDRGNDNGVERTTPPTGNQVLLELMQVSQD